MRQIFPKSGLGIRILIILFSLIFVLASIDTYWKSSTTIFFNKLFYMGLGNEHFFTMFEIVLILILFSFINKYGITYSNTQQTIKFIFVLFCITFLLKMLNPNNNPNNPILGMPLFSNISNFTSLLLIYFSFYLKYDGYNKFIKSLFYLIGIFLTVRLIFLSFMWILGKGDYGFGANSTLTEADSLYVIAFYQIIFFVLFLIKKEKRYLFLWLFYFLFQFFSFRRSALGVALVTNILTYVFYLWKSKKFINKFALILSIIIIFFVFKNIQSFNLPPTFENYIMRFVSAIPGMSEENSKIYNDSGHWEQTTETFYSAFHSLGFWGRGYGNGDEVYLKGQSSVIHNVYAASWEFYGIYMPIFYLLIIFIIIYKFFKLFFNKEFINNKLQILTLSIAFFLLAWFAVLVTNPLFMIDNIKMQVFWITIFAVMMRINPENIVDFSNKETNQYV